MHPSRLAQLTASAEQYLGDIGPARVTSEWCGLRPCTPDGLPVVGRLPGQTKVFAATGHAMTGLTLGPITGSLVADLVTGATPPSTEVTALAPARF